MNITGLTLNAIKQLSPDRKMSAEDHDKNLLEFRNDFINWNPFPEYWYVTFGEIFNKGFEFGYFRATHGDEYCVIVTDGSWIYTEMKYNHIESSSGRFINQRDEVKKFITDQLEHKKL